MKYAKLINGYIVQIVESDIEQIDFVPLDFEVPQCPGAEYKFNYAEKKWEVDVQQQEGIAKQKIMSNRQEFLLSSDWTQLPNGPLTAEVQQQWAVYRQQLRDITSQSGYPFNVVWPTQPE